MPKKEITHIKAGLEVCPYDSGSVIELLLSRFLWSRYESLSRARLVIDFELYSSKSMVWLNTHLGHRAIVNRTDAISCILLFFLLYSDNDPDPTGCHRTFVRPFIGLCYAIC